jgi:DNA repair protein RecO (recombination protein O)
MEVTVVPKGTFVPDSVMPTRSVPEVIPLTVSTVEPAVMEAVTIGRDAPATVPPRPRRLRQGRGRGDRSRSGGLMDFHEEAFVQSALTHGDTGAVVDLLTENHGRRSAYVAGGASRKMKPFLQAGARVVADYRARTSDHLGAVRLEPVGEGPSALFDDALALTGLAAAAGVTQGALPEREPHPGVFLAFEALMSAFALPEVWPAIFVRFEMGLLDDLGFGLDLSKCAATGSSDDLIYVSPRTGRAVSRDAGAPYADRLLPLPRFLRVEDAARHGANAPPSREDVFSGFNLTGHFLARDVLNPRGAPDSEARRAYLARLAAAPEF